MGNTFNDAISCLKMLIDLYTRSTYTRVYTANTLSSMLLTTLSGEGILLASFLSNSW